MDSVSRQKLDQVFSDLRGGKLGVAAEPNSKTKFKSKFDRVGHNLQTELDTAGKWGKVLGYGATVLGVVTLTLPVYWAVKGKFTQYVNPITRTGSRHSQFISQVTKSQWKTLSRFSKGDQDHHSNTVKDSILRSNAMKIIKNRSDAEDVMALLKQCTTRQLCQLARGIGKEEHIQVPEDSGANELSQDAGAGASKPKMTWKLSWSPKIFEELRQIQRDIKTPLLGESILKTFENYEVIRDQVAAQVSFKQPTQALGVDIGAHLDVPGRPDSALPDLKGHLTPHDLKSLRDLGAELLLPSNLAQATVLLQGGDKATAALRQILFDHRVAVALLCARPDDGAQAQLPPGLAQALRRALGLTSPMTVNPPPPLEQWQSRLSQVETAIQSLDSEKARILLEDSSQVVTNFDFSSFSSQLAAIDTGLQGPMKSFFDELFKNYFSQQPPEDRRNMVASLMRGSAPTDTSEYQLAALLKGAGPFMHKTLQLFCDKVKDERTKTALSSVKTGLTPIDRELKTAMLAKIVQDSNGKIQSLTDVETLGAASVGEALLAHVQLPPDADGQSASKNVVIKLLRPGIVERAQRERIFFAETASHHQGMGQTFVGIAEQIEAEMDLKSEAKNVQLGQVYNGQTPGLEAMKLSTLLPAQSDYMVVEQAAGTTLQGIIDLCEKAARGEEVPPDFNTLEYGQAAAQQVAKLGQVWMTQALAGGGFFHGDLHAGNLMFKGESGVLTVIDFGNAGAIAPTQRQTLIRLAMALQQGHPRLFEKEFRHLLGPTAETLAWSWKPALILEIKSIMRDQEVEMADKLAKILEVYTSKGIEVPAVISNFSRSMLMLQETLGRLKEVNRKNHLRNQADSGALLKHQDMYRQQLVGGISQEMADRLTKQITDIDARLSDFEVPESVSLGDAFSDAIRPHALSLAWRAGLGFSARVATPGISEHTGDSLEIARIRDEIKHLDKMIRNPNEISVLREAYVSKRNELQTSLNQLLSKQAPNNSEDAA